MTDRITNYGNPRWLHKLADKVEPKQCYDCGRCHDCGKPLGSRACRIGMCYLCTSCGYKASSWMDWGDVWSEEEVDKIKKMLTDKYGVNWEMKE